MIIRRPKHRSGYTLLEVVAAAAVVAIGMTGAVSLSTSIIAQEEITWRVAIARNYQENVVRLWQLGLDPLDTMRIIPSISGNPKLLESVDNVLITPTGTANEDSMGTMESASCVLTLGTSGFPGVGAGNTNQVTAYRPSLK